MARCSSRVDRKEGSERMRVFRTPGAARVAVGVAVRLRKKS